MAFPVYKQINFHKKVLFLFSQQVGLDYLEVSCFPVKIQTSLNMKVSLFQLSGTNNSIHKQDTTIGKTPKIKFNPSQPHQLLRA